MDQDWKCRTRSSDQLILPGPAGNIVARIAPTPRASLRPVLRTKGVSSFWVYPSRYGHAFAGLQDACGFRGTAVILSHNEALSKRLGHGLSGDEAAYEHELA